MLYLILSFHSYFTIKCTTFGSKSLSILLFPIKQQQQQLKLKKCEIKCKIKLNQVQLYSLVNIVLFREKFAEYDHPIECSSEQLQLLVIQ